MHFSICQHFLKKTGFVAKLWLRTLLNFSGEFKTSVYKECNNWHDEAVANDNKTQNKQTGEKKKTGKREDKPKSTCWLNLILSGHNLLAFFLLSNIWLILLRHFKSTVQFTDTAGWISSNNTLILVSFYWFFYLTPALKKELCVIISVYTLLDLKT